MKTQIGTDEAGYGPNLGPLTIAGSVWQIDHANEHPTELFQLLTDTVTNNRAELTADRLFVADSKLVHDGKRLECLELPVLAMLTANLGLTPQGSLELLKRIGPPSIEAEFAKQHWLNGAELSLPVAAPETEIERLAEIFQSACKNGKVELRTVRCETVFPDRFNAGVNTLGNKATLLSAETLKLVRQLLDETETSALVGCDKHGGRSKYAGLIQTHLTDEFVFVGTESSASSDYRFRDKSRDVELRFTARGESFLPTAFSSMVAKYIREILMIQWNSFWKNKLPNLKPTKGYPLDAKRFKRDIAKVQRTLGIGDEAIWRRV